MTLALWLLVYLLLAFAIGRLLEATVGWSVVWRVCAPGMLVAGGGRFAACLLGQQSPGRVDLMRADGPSARGGLPEGGWFRFAYALGPFVATVAVFILAWMALDQPLDPGRTLPRLAFETSAVERGADAARAHLSGFLAEFGDQRLGDWRMWLFLYLGGSLVIASAPSRDDLVAIGAVCAVTGLVVFGLAQAGVDVVATRVYRSAVWEGFSLLLGMALFVLGAAALSLLPLKLLRRKD